MSNPATTQPRATPSRHREKRPKLAHNKNTTAPISHLLPLHKFQNWRSSSHLQGNPHTFKLDQHQHLLPDWRLDSSPRTAHWLWRLPIGTEQHWHYFGRRHDYRYIIYLTGTALCLSVVGRWTSNRRSQRASKHRACLADYSVYPCWL